MGRLNVAAFVAALLIVAVSARCPNSCSGRGRCGVDDICTCHRGYGGAPDCSLRTCPYDKAWADTPASSIDGHGYAECSGKGICDREFGECKCMDGFTGRSCERMVCPNACSGNGVCTSMEQAGKDTSDKRGHGYNDREWSYDTSSGWEASRAMFCKCDDGFTGVDCSLRVCPRGDDPLTVEEAENMIQYIAFGDGYTAVAADDQAVVTFYDKYGGKWSTLVTVGATRAATATNVQAALRALPSNRLKGVTATAATAGGSIKVWDRTNKKDSSVSFTDTALYHTIKIQFSSNPGETGQQFKFECDMVPHATTKGHQPKSAGFDHYILDGSASDKITGYAWDATAKLNEITYAATSAATVTTLLQYAQEHNIPIVAEFSSGYNCTLYLDKDETQGSGSIFVEYDANCPTILSTTNSIAGKLYIGGRCTAFEAAVDRSGDGAVYDATDLALYSEDAVCSNRGICDESTGECQCFSGHKGVACESQDALI